MRGTRTTLNQIEVVETAPAAAHSPMN